MAFMSCDKLCSSKFYNNVSSEIRLQDEKLQALNVNLNKTYKKHEKVRSNYESSNDENVVNAAFLDPN